MRRSRTRHPKGGFVLIAVLGAVLVLCALVFSFTQATRTNLGAADSFYRTEQVRNGAWAGLNIALAAIRDTNDLQVEPRLAKLLTGENRFSIDEASCSITIAEENGR